MRVFINIAFYRIKSFYRDTFTFLFTIILPLIFVIIFGFVFGESATGTNEYGISLGIIKDNSDLVQVLKELGDMKVVLVDNEEELRNQVLGGYIDGGVIFDRNEFNLLINFSSFQQKPFLRTLGENLANVYALHEIGKGRGIVKVEEEFIDPGKVRVTSLGYSIPGVLSFSISGSIFTMIALFGYYRKRKVLKRFAVTPISPLSFVSGMVFANVILSILSCILVLLVAQIIFNLNFSINWGLFLLSLFSSILGMMVLGIILSALFKEPQTANNVGNLLVNIMLFFSGVYFPLDFLPNYLKILARFLPLYYVGKALRISVGVEEGDLSFIYTLSTIMVLIFVFLISIFGRKILSLEED
uniref:ABC transporter permease n=1 Tax=Dictyoglomus thermophilum TaxID=14 RepID=A0A7C3MLK6_DICTH